MSVNFRGRKTCSCVVQSVALVEKRMLGAGLIKECVDITQGGYNNGAVPQSGGTHDGGGAIDFRQYSTAQLKVWRECGWYAWHRTPSMGSWAHHGHGVLNGCPHMSAGAKRQVAAGKRGRNGLANNGRDDGPRVQVPTWKAALRKYGEQKPPAPKPPAHKPLISLSAVQTALLAGGRLFVGEDGKQLQIVLNRFHDYVLTVDGLLGPKTRRSCALAQLIIAQRKGSKLTKDDCWPAKGHHADLDGILGPEGFAALGINNSDDTKR